MPRYVVLLRGINVGKAKRVPMADLRALLDDLGYSAVKTVLNSGNAVVTGPDDDPVRQASRIEAAVAEKTGVAARCVVLTADELRAIVAGHPFVEIATNGSRMFAHVLGAEPDPALLAENDPVALDPEHARLGDRVLYQWCPEGILQAPVLAGFVEKRLGVVVTARNWNTIEKLAALL